MAAPRVTKQHRRIQRRRLESAKRLWKGPIFKKVPQFLKTHRISLTYCLASNINQTFLNKGSFVFLLCPEIYRFCAVFGRFGGPCPRAPPPSESAYAKQVKLVGLAEKFHPHIWRNGGTRTLCRTQKYDQSSARPNRLVVSRDSQGHAGSWPSSPHKKKRPG